MNEVIQENLTEISPWEEKKLVKLAKENVNKLLYLSQGNRLLFLPPKVVFETGMYDKLTKDEIVRYIREKQDLSVEDLLKYVYSRSEFMMLGASKIELQYKEAKLRGKESIIQTICKVYAEEFQKGVSGTIYDVSWNSERNFRYCLDQVKSPGQELLYAQLENKTLEGAVNVARNLENCLVGCGILKVNNTKEKDMVVKEISKVLPMRVVKTYALD